MEITNEYAAYSTKNNNLSNGIFRISSQTKKSKIIEFLDDLYTYPPKFNVKWDSLDELHEDLFMSYNYRSLEHNSPFLKVLGEFNQDQDIIEKENIKDKFSTKSYVEGYLNKLVSTKFYGKQTKQIQESLQTVPIYVILNGQGNIILGNSTDQINKNTTSISNLLYNFCGSFDPLAENSSQLGLFFMSKSDAELYLQEIARSDVEGTRMVGLSLHCFGLDFAYRVIREYHPGIDFRIIPDLTEIKKLLQQGINKTDLIFEDEQQQLRFRRRSINILPIIKNWSFPFFSFLEKTEYFKGTPIYIVQSNSAQKNLLLQKYNQLVNFFDSGYNRINQSIKFILGFGNDWITQGSLKEQNYSDNSTTYVFFEKQSALNFCNNTKRNIETYNKNSFSKFSPLGRKSKIYVYNLEDFLELWEETLTEKYSNTTESNFSTLFNSQTIRLIPTKNSIVNLEKFAQQPQKSSFQNFKQFINFKTRCLIGFINTVLNTN